MEERSYNLKNLIYIPIAIALIAWARFDLEIAAWRIAIIVALAVPVGVAMFELKKWRRRRRRRKREQEQQWDDSIRKSR